jgi:NAD(P)-dependent dehydrogenase (short-subunit alcohol dehydrogenase family)
MADRRTALVTGASQGIGAAVAVALARAGHDVAVTSTRPDRLDGVMAAIRAAGARAARVALDLRAQPSIERAMAGAIAALGRVDLLVNNAAVPLKKPAMEVTASEWETVIDTGLTGTFFLCQQMGRHLVATNRAGSIVNIASTHGLVALQDRAVYGIAKAGVMHMARMLAIEWAEHRIRVNAVAPGRVDTPSRAASLAEPGYQQVALARIPLKRYATSEEVAAAVVYLASPEADYITGQTLVLDGGLTAA